MKHFMRKYDKHQGLTKMNERERNKHILKVLMSCRTLDQVLACEDWVCKQYSFLEDSIDELPFEYMTEFEMYSFIDSMKVYIRRIT